MRKSLIAIFVSTAALALAACAPSPSRDVPGGGGTTGSKSCTDCGRIINIDQLVGSAANGLPDARVAGVPDNLDTFGAPAGGVSGPVGGVTGTVGGLTGGATRGMVGSTPQPMLMPPPRGSQSLYRVTVALDNGPVKTMTVNNLGGLGVGDKVKLIGNEIVPR